MKKLVIVAAIFFVLGVFAKEMENNTDDVYLRQGKIIAFNGETVTVEDNNGNLWDFQGVEDWHIGDGCTMLMDSNGTTEIEDDVIVRNFYTK